MARKKEKEEEKIVLQEKRMTYFTVAAGLSGALAVGLGAYGAHGIKQLNNEFKEIWKVLFLFLLSSLISL